MNVVVRARAGWEWMVHSAAEYTPRAAETAKCEGGDGGERRPHADKVSGAPHNNVHSERDSSSEEVRKGPRE
jgi:hypothetical protein